MSGRTSAPPEQRFWEKVDKSGEYWLWTGSRTSGGYGTFYRGNGVYALAHRFVYELAYRSIPQGLHLDHLCRVRNCVNPEHLEAVTAKENNLRGVGVAAQNATKTHCPLGHPYSPANTRIMRSRGRLGRHCKICDRISNAKRYAKGSVKAHTLT